MSLEAKQQVRFRIVSGSNEPQNPSPSKMAPVRIVDNSHQNTREIITSDILNAASTSTPQSDVEQDSDSGEIVGFNAASQLITVKPSFIPSPRDPRLRKGDSQTPSLTKIVPVLPASVETARKNLSPGPTSVFSTPGRAAAKFPPTDTWITNSTDPDRPLHTPLI